MTRINNSNGTLPPEPKGMDLRAARIAELIQQGKTQKKIALELGINQSNVSRLMKKYSIEKEAKIPLEVLKRLYIDEKKSTPEIAAQFGTDHSAVIRMLKSNGIPVRSPQEAVKNYLANSGSMNYDIVKADAEKLNEGIEPNAAYALGLFVADGSVPKKQHKSPSIELGTQDRDVLESLHNFFPDTTTLTYQHPQGRENGSSVLRFRGQDLKTPFIKHGIQPDKVHTLTAPADLPESSWRHYIRGFFDGNGVINNKDNQLQLAITSPNTAVLGDIQKKLEAMDITSTVRQPEAIKELKPKSNPFRLDIHNDAPNVLRFYNALYSGSPQYPGQLIGMERKQNVLEETVEKILHSPNLGKLKFNIKPF